MLADVKVLDLSRILAGPWATQLLADYGAEVIKIEHPERGDDTRSWGPPYLRDGDGNPTSESAYFLSTNRGKRSLAIDISSAAGQAIIRQLAESADVLVENFKVGALARYGLDYESLKTLNPRLIYCSITGFGQTGPDAQRVGYDAMIQAMGGLMSITGQPDDSPGAGPVKVGVAVADLMCGMYAHSAILAALHARQTDGLGRHLDLALFDTQVAWLANQASNYLISDDVPERRGSAHPNIVPYQAFETSDGHLMLAVGNDEQFRRLCGCCEIEALGTDPRFARNADRVVNREALLALLEPILARYALDHWLSKLHQAGVPCGPINTLDRVFSEPQLAHRQMRQELDHPLNRRMPSVSCPVRVDGERSSSKSPPPLLGQHSDAVLAELGYDELQIAEFKQSGIVRR